MNDANQTITCPNCGAVRPAGIEYCSNCGYGRPDVLPPSRKTPIAWILMFALLGVPAGCLGGCFLLIGSGTGGSPEAVLGGLLGVAIFIAMLVMLIRSSKG